jgi:RNA recognition motif-containing protein
MATSALRAAIEGANGKLILDQKVYVAAFKTRRQRMDELEQAQRNFTNVFVKDLPTDVTEEEFTAMFSKFGTVCITHARASCNLPPLKASPWSGRSVSHGGVCFSFRCWTDQLLQAGSRPRGREQGGWIWWVSCSPEWERQACNRVLMLPPNV